MRPARSRTAAHADAMAAVKAASAATPVGLYGTASAARGPSVTSAASTRIARAAPVAAQTGARQTCLVRTASFSALRTTMHTARSRTAPRAYATTTVRAAIAVAARVSQSADGGSLAHRRVTPTARAR